MAVSIKVGMTEAEVIQAIGEPTSKVDSDDIAKAAGLQPGQAGEKVITWFYKHSGNEEYRIIFQDGKVYKARGVLPPQPGDKPVKKWYEFWK